MYLKVPYFLWILSVFLLYSLNRTVLTTKVKSQSTNTVHVKALCWSWSTTERLLSVIVFTKRSDLYKLNPWHYWSLLSTIPLVKLRIGSRWDSEVGRNCVPRPESECPILQRARVLPPYETCTQTKDQAPKHGSEKAMFCFVLFF